MKKRVTQKKNLREWFSPALPYVTSAFQTLLVTYLVLLVVNQFKVVFYPAYLDILLGIVIALGVITVLSSEEKKERVVKRTRKDTMLIWALGIIGLVLIYFKTGLLGWLQYVISILGGILIVLLGYLVYEPEEEDAPLYLKVTWRGVLISFLTLVLVSSILSYWLGWNAFRIVFGAVFVLFVPGFSLSYAFFGATEVDALERLAVSFALSIAVVPLLVFYLNLAGMRISAVSVSFVVLFVTALGYVAYRYRRNVKRR